jgi:DUF1680 family protein
MSLTIALLLAAKLSATPERRVLLPFDYSDVRITGGVLRRQLDQAVEDYLRIPNDDLLLGFRRRAGLPAPGHELGGWYSDDVFHVFGQILSGLARMYAATGDPSCKAKADALLDGWTQCIGKDGYFYYSKQPNAPHYIYDKMVGGLVDMALYCKRRDALTALSKITGWAERNLDRSNRYAYGQTEWYTLSENLYRAYLATADERYGLFAKVWEYTPYWKQYANGKSIFDKRPDGGQTARYHAYSHVNNLGGAALAYRVSGSRWYLDTIKNAYDFLQANECFATGGFGPDETLATKEQVKAMLEETTSTFETQCGTWAVFKLCKNLIALTGDARYGDWIEKAAYNGIAATIPMTPNGRVFYYSDYNPFGGSKINVDVGWSCCTGTRPMAIADVCDVAYFRAPDGLDVNLFVPSVARFGVGRAQVELTQSTRFPESPSTLLTIGTDRTAEFTLRIRKAGWFSGPVRATINGSPVTLDSDGKNWLGIRRKWANGDRLAIQLPVGFRSIPFGATASDPTAIAVGPVVLAFRANEAPLDKLDLTHLAGNFIPVPGEPLNYRLRGDPNVLARPFYEYKADEPYYLYLDRAAVGRIPYRKLKTDGPWRSSGKLWFCNVPGSWCEGTFEGKGVKLLGYLFDDAGRAEVRIDGKVVGVIDQFGPGRDIPKDWTFAGLSARSHTIRITILSGKSDASKDRYINVAGLQRL